MGVRLKAIGKKGRGEREREASNINKVMGQM